MITLKRGPKQPYEITNDAGSAQLAASANNEFEAFNPGDFLNSSIATCVALNLDSLIERDQLDIPGYSIEVSGTRAEDARPRRLGHFDLHVKFDGEIDDKVRERLVKSAKRACTMGNTVEHGAPINVTSD